MSNVQPFNSHSIQICRLCIQQSFDDMSCFDNQVSEWFTIYVTKDNVVFNIQSLFRQNSTELDDTFDRVHLDLTKLVSSVWCPRNLLSATPAQTYAFTLYKTTLLICKRVLLASTSLEFIEVFDNKTRTTVSAWKTITEYKVTSFHSCPQTLWRHQKFQSK